MQSDKTANPASTRSLNPNQWVINYADYLYRYAIVRINQEEQCRDLVQETFLAALEKADQFEGRSTEKTWLTAILRNKIIDLYRKKSSGLAPKDEVRHQEVLQEDFFDAENGHWNVEHQPKAFAAQPDEVIQNREFNHILQMCMKKLPALWFAVFSMKHMDEEQTEVICTELKLRLAWKKTGFKAFNMNTLTKIIYNCRKATFLIEKKQFSPLSTREKLELNLHLAGCSVCRLFQQQSLLINQWIKKRFPSQGNAEVYLDENFKEKLQQRINQEMNKN
eukprot:gene15025-18193_t